MKRVYILLLLLTALAVIYVKNSQVSKNLENNEINKKNQAQYKEIDNNLKQINTVQNLKINNTENFNYLKKSKIYAIRKKYVKDSLFNTEDYEPSEAVFGQIEDNKPWYGLKYYNCASSTIGKNDLTLGDSEESRFINNPNVLVGINEWVYTNKNYTNDSFCKDLKYTKKLINLTYRPDSNTIVATFKRPIGGTFNLTGINARDFGYNYIAAESVENVIFLDKANISNGIYKFEDYIHTGSSCGLNGGCNNCSPNQTYLDFKLKDNIRAKIKLKLWRKKPKTMFDKADIYFYIIFHTY